MSVLSKSTLRLHPLVLPLFAVSGALCVWWFYLIRYSSNIPYWDDFLWAIHFINQWTEATSANQKWEYLSNFYFEHRIIWLRLALLLNHAWSGALNFKVLTLAGNIGLLALPFLFVRAMPERTLHLKMRHFWPITLILWQPQCFQNMFTTYGISNHFTILFVIATVYVLVYYPSRLVLAFLLAFLSTLTTGAGIIVWGLGFSILLWQNRLKELAIWSLVTAGCVSCYFGIGSGPVSSALPNVPLTTKLLNLPFYIPTFLFSIFDFGSLKTGKIIAMAVGLVATASLGRLIYIQLKPVVQSTFWYRLPQTLWKERYALTVHQVFLLHIVVFILLAGLSASFNRVGPKFNQWSLPYYYRLYSQLLLIILYCWGLQYVQYRKQLQKIGIVFAGVFWMASYYFNTAHAVNLQNQLMADAFNFKTHGQWVFYPSFRGEKEYNLINNATHKSIEKGLWELPPQSSHLIENATICLDCEADIHSDNTKLTIRFLGNPEAYQPNPAFSAYYDGHTTWLSPLPQSNTNPVNLFKFGSVIQPAQSATMLINRYFFNGYKQNVTLAGHWQFKSIPTLQAFSSLKKQIDKKGYVTVLNQR